MLNWYGKVTAQQRKWIKAQAEKEGVRVPYLDGGTKGAMLYSYLATPSYLGSPKAASEFLARAGIDGVKYPVDSYGKTVKDGSEVGWNYVSFRDDNIRIDHKWVDGEQRFSLSITPEVRRDTTVDASTATLEKTKAALKALAGKPLHNDETGIDAQINAVQANKIVSNEAVRKSINNGFSSKEHNAAAAIIDRLWKYATLGKSAPDRNNDPNIASIKRFVSPVFFGNKSAYAYITAKESVEHGHRIYSLELEKLEALTGKLKGHIPSSASAQDANSIPNLPSPRQGGEMRFSVVQTTTPKFKAWFGDWENNPVNASKVVDTDGKPKVVYHGTGRADRVGNIFRPDRATSGPMAFFTDNESIASGYARDKADTSLAYDDPDVDFHHRFRMRNGESNSRLMDAWYRLSPEDRERITENAKHVRLDDQGENIIIDPNADDGIGNLDWETKKARGNMIKALVGSWCDSGTLFNEESRMLEVFDKSGITEAIRNSGLGEIAYNDPNYREEKVYAVYLNIRNPFKTESVNEVFADKFQKWYKRQNKAKYRRENAQTDHWDKNGITIEEWLEDLSSDIKNGTSYAWTSIPDAVTDYLKKLGHDGIEDAGGKGGGISHTVYIPFESTQVKSATDNTGAFDAQNPDIRFSIYAVGRYAGRLRSLAHGLKQGDAAAIEESAWRMADLVPDNAVLVPIPGHLGRASSTLRLAEAIAALKPGASVVDALEAEPHESNYDQKKRLHKPPKSVNMWRREGVELPEDRPVYFIDNVVASGKTYYAAQKAIPGADMLTLADTMRQTARELPDLTEVDAAVRQKKAAFDAWRDKWDANRYQKNFDAYTKAFGEYADAVASAYDSRHPDEGVRFSINPHLREDVNAALNTDPTKGEVVKGGKRVVFGRSQRLFPALGLPDGDIYSKAYALRKIAADHNLTAEQIISAPDLIEEPAVVFDDNSNGFIFLTDAIAKDEDGNDAPIMFYIRPDGEGNYIASAYARKEQAESKYVNLVNAGMVRYFDKNKIARLPLRGEAQSSLITFSAGDNVVTPERVNANIIPNSSASRQGGSDNIVSPVELRHFQK